MRGRKRVPTALNRVRGNPGKRKRNEREPEVRTPVGDPPAHLNAEERELWRQCARVGFWLTEANRATLEGYVTAWAMMARVKPEIEKGLVDRGPNGGALQNPYLAIYNKAREQMLKFAVELGFTPVSITKVRAPEEEKQPGGELVAFEGGKR